MSDAEKLQQFLAAATHMVLAVTLADHTPWAVPVRMHVIDGGFEWDSKVDTVHSQALAAHRQMAITVFSKEKGKEIGFYAIGTGEEISRRDDGYARYRFTPTETWLNDETFVKRRVHL